MGAKDTVLARLHSLYVARKAASGLSTTLSANAAAGATSITVGSITSGASGDAIRIGTGEQYELAQISGAPSGSTITLARPLAKAHLAGEAVDEVTVYDHGDPTDAGVNVRFSGESQDILVATKRLVFGQLKGYVSAGAEWAWPAFTLHNLATAVGALLSRVTGAGTTSSPRHFSTDGNNFGEDSDIAIIGTGVKVDGTYIAVELWGCSMDYTALRSQLTRGQLASIPARARSAGGGIAYTSAPAYTIDTSIRGTKAKVWDAPSEVALYAANGGGSTTLAAGCAADAASISLTASTSFAAGDRVKIGADDTAEVVIIDSISGAGPYTAALRTPTLRAHAASEAVVEVGATAFAGVTEEGASLEVGGSVRNVRFATSRLEAGVIPGEANPSIGVSLADLSLANFAYALGIPQSEIASGRLPIGTKIGTADIDIFAVKGTTQGGDITEILAVGCTQQVQEVAIAMNGRDLAKLPLNLRPSAALHFWQYQ